MNKIEKTIPIFFAVDNEYIPFLAVALKSLVDNSTKENKYEIRILYANVSEEDQNKIKKYERENISIEFVDMQGYIKKIQDKLYTRDYFSKATYFRLFLPELYPQYDKVLYLDSDIVIRSDIADLYNMDIGDNLILGTPDGVIQNTDVFKDYAELVVGVSDYRNYFNAGIIVMNLKELRKFEFEKKFLYLLGTIKFSVAQDQDYLNRLCKGRVKLVDDSWDRMPISGDTMQRDKIHVVHYNLISKPWHFDNVLYEEYFWEYANKTEYIDKIKEIKANYTDKQRKIDSKTGDQLFVSAQKECDCVGDDRKYRRI